MDTFDYILQEKIAEYEGNWPIENDSFAQSVYELIDKNMNAGFVVSTSRLKSAFRGLQKDEIFNLRREKDFTEKSKQFIPTVNTLLSSFYSTSIATAVYPHAIRHIHNKKINHIKTYRMKVKSSSQNEFMRMNSSVYYPDGSTLHAFVKARIEEITSEKQTSTKCLEVRINFGEQLF